MRLENLTLGNSLNSKDETKVLHALLTLYGQCISSRSISNYIPTIIDILCIPQESFSKSYQGKNPVLLHICMNLLKSCLDYLTDTEKHAIMKFVASEFIQTGNFWLLRDITELCFDNFSLYETFFLQENELLPVELAKKTHKNWSIVGLLFYGGIQKSICLRQRLSNANGVVNVTIPLVFESLETEQTIILLNFLHHIVKYSFESEKNWDFLYEDFYLLLLDKISETNQVISHAAFRILNDLICQNSNYHSNFYGQVLPIRLSKQNIIWIQKFYHHFDLLTTRLKCMGVNRSFIGFRPLTYIALYLMEENDTSLSKNSIDISSLNQLLLPLLSTVDPTTVMEAAHCVLLLSFDSELVTSEFSTSTSREVDLAVLALVNLLNRDLPHITRLGLYKDICSLINCIRDKFYVCSKLIDHLTHIKDEECRIYVLTCISRTLIQLSVNSRLKTLYDLQSGNKCGTSGSTKYQTTELTMFFKEPILRYIWRAKLSMKFEMIIRAEILFCLCQEYLSLSKANNVGNNSKSVENLQLRAWLSVGLEIIEQCRDCIQWEFSNSSISRFFKLLTFVCTTIDQTNLHQADEGKRLQAQLQSILEDMDQCKTEYGQLLILSVLSSFIHLHKQSNSGMEVSDLVFQNLSKLLRLTCTKHAQKKSISKPIFIDVLIQALLVLCYRSPIKIQESLALIGDLISLSIRTPIANQLAQILAKLKYVKSHGAFRNQDLNSKETEMLFGTQFYYDHYIFQSFYSREDDKLILDYIRGLQTIIDTSANIHDSDPFYIQQSGTQNLQKVNRVFKKPRVVQVAYKMDHVKEMHMSQIISLPSDPLHVSASYTFSLQNATLVLKIQIHNPTNIPLYHASVEIGTSGAFHPSGNSLVSTKIVGKLLPDTTFNFSQEFKLAQFSRCSFAIVILGLSSERSTSQNEFLGIKEKSDDLLRMRCLPIEVQVMHMLRKQIVMKHSDFLTLWESFQASYHVHLSVSNPESVIDSICTMMSQTPFLHVNTAPNHIKGDMFQLCFTSRTLFGDFILLLVFGYRGYDGNIICDCEFRATSPSMLEPFKIDDGKWIEREWLTREDIAKSIQIIPKDVQTDSYIDVFNNTTTNYNYIDVQKVFQIDSLQHEAFHVKKWQKMQTQNASVLSK